MTQTPATPITPALIRQLIEEFDSAHTEAVYRSTQHSLTGKSRRWEAIHTGRAQAYKAVIERLRQVLGEKEEKGDDR
jgi:hypothetical protein